MLAELKLELICPELNWRKSSNLHGVLMDQIDEGYAAELHLQQVHPYSQCLLTEGDRKYWCIRTLDQRAYENIILPMMRVNGFELNKGSIHADVGSRTCRTLEKNALLEEFYDGRGLRCFDLEFQTPTAFKSGGRYVFYPDLMLLYQSLMNRYTLSSADMEMRDPDTLEQMVQGSEVLRYRLQTVPFPMEGVTVTGFKGTLRIRLKGTDTMARYIRLLMRFGEFSGVGIKTGIGMGAIRYMEIGKGGAEG